MYVGKRQKVLYNSGDSNREGMKIKFVNQSYCNENTLKYIKTKPQKGGNCLTPPPPPIKNSKVYCCKFGRPSRQYLFCRVL